MSGEVYTVERAADRLGLHPKTVRRFIQEGRLKATRIGKAYRILRADLDALVGAPAAPSTAPVRVTAIVDLPQVEPQTARRLAAVLPAARTGNAAQGPPMSLDFAHDPALRTLKIVMIGSPDDVAAMLRLVQASLDAEA